MVKRNEKKKKGLAILKIEKVRSRSIARDQIMHRLPLIESLNLHALRKAEARFFGVEEDARQLYAILKEPYSNCCRKLFACSHFLLALDHDKTNTQVPFVLDCCVVFDRVLFNKVGKIIRLSTLLYLITLLIKSQKRQEKKKRRKKEKEREKIK